MTAIAILHKDEILKRVAKGDKIADIGKTYKTRLPVPSLTLHSHLNTVYTFSCAGVTVAGAPGGVGSSFGGIGAVCAGLGGRGARPSMMSPI